MYFAPVPLIGLSCNNNYTYLSVATRIPGNEDGARKRAPEI